MADNIDNNDYLSLPPSLRVSNSEGRGSDADITVPTPPISSPPISSPPTPRRSLYISNLSNAQNIQSSAALKKQLQDQLKEYSDQLKLTDELSAALKKQQLEIDNQIKELDKTEGDEVPQEIRSKLADLEKELSDINTKSTKVLLRSNLSATATAAKLDSPNSSTPTTPATEVPSTVPGKSSSRRDRNAQKGRQKDIEFATEIGQGLLQEVRRLQALLQEKEEKIKELEAEKAELERNIEQLNKTLRSKEDSEDRLNKYVETLELARQELSNQLEELQQQLNRARSDYTKIEKALATATDVIEQLKDKEEKLTSSLENLKIRHEKDMQNNRRHIAALNREKSDLTQTINDLKSQLDTFLNASKIKKSTKDMATGSNNNLSYGDDGQVISGDDIDSSFPQELLNKNLNAKDTMKALGVANRMIGNLRANLQKEKSEKYELKKLLIDSQEQIEAMQAEIYDVTATTPNRSKRQINNNLPGELSDISESDANSTNSEKINKDNRPSSDWFTSDKSKRRLVSGQSRSRSSLLSRESADVDIIPGEDEYDEKKEIVEARRAEALRKLGDNNVLSREIVGEPGTLDDDDIYENSDLRHKDSVVRRRVTEYEDISKQNADDESITRRGTSQSSKYDEARSPNDDRRRTDSVNSNIDSSSATRSISGEATRPISGEATRSISGEAARSISGEITIPKEFRDIGVQTDSGERSDSMTTFGNNRDTAIYDNNSQDSKTDPTSQSNLTVPNNNENKRFTLDLSNNQQSRPRGILQNSSKPQSPVQSLDPPPRPINGPSASLIQRSASVNFGQQAGASKVQQSLNGAHKSSADSQDGILSSKPKTRDINNLSVGEPTSTLHNHSSSSGSISTSSSASITAEQANKSSENNGPMAGPSGTDPNIIHAITQTMIGEYLWKYTRRNFGVDKRHKRFFWVHPYTKTLYWSNKDPSNHEPVDPKSKSGTSYFAYIESVRQIVDHNPSPPGLHHMSLIIKTPERELKITAKSKERHEYWYQALLYLLQQRSDDADKVNQGQVGQGQTPGRPGRVASDPWDKQPTRNLFDSTSPTGSLKDGNLKKKSSFNKIQSMFRRNESPLSSEYIDGQSQQLAVPGTSQNGFDDDFDDDEDYDLENVRQCCDGRHDVSKLERAGTHKGHHHNNRIIGHS